MGAPFYDDDERAAELQRRIDECDEKRLAKLDLRGMRLRELPEALLAEARPWVTELDLGQHESIEYKSQSYIIDKEKRAWNSVRITPDKLHNSLPNLASLNLNSNNIGDNGAKALAALPSLKILNLHRNNIGYMGAKALSSLPFLEQLNLGDNHIQDEGAIALAPLSSLVKLNVQFNDIGSEGATSLCALISLNSLDLGDNIVGDEAANKLSNLTKLTHLTLQSCFITDAGAKALGKLSALEYLNLYANGISNKGAIAIATLTMLKHLNLDTNNVKSAGAKALGNLVNLIDLNLDNNYIQTEGAIALANLTNLKTLMLSNNRIGDKGVKALSSLTSLETLYLGGNNISEIGAKALVSLKWLRTLDLSEAQLNEPCSELWSLPNLQAVSLYNGQISSIPEEVIPNNLGENCLPRLRAYLASLESGTETITDVKLMVLGNGLTGKTQMCRRLRDEPFDATEASTHGIDISTTTLTCPNNNEDIKFHIWDFGGQDIYLGTHSLFLNNRAVFPIVWMPASETNTYHEIDGQKYKNLPLSYWLEYVRQFGDEKSPVVVIQAQCDTPDCDKPQLPVPVNNDAFASLTIRQFSAKTDRGKPALEQALCEAAQLINDKQGTVTLGKGWARVKRKLEDILEADRKLEPAQRQHQLLSMQDFYNICNEENDVPDPKYLLDYLQMIGTVFYREDLFKDQIILDQEWALDAIYTIFHREKSYSKIRSRGGRFTLSDLGEMLWNDAGYTPKEQGLFLNMMLSCGMCFEHRSEVKYKNIETEYLAPDLLPETFEDKAIMWDEDSEKQTCTYKYKLLFPALMRNIVSHVGSEAGLKAFYWRDGLLIYEANTGSRALIEQNISSDWGGEIVINTQKGRAEDLLLGMMQIVEEQQRIAGIKHFSVATERTLTEAGESITDQGLLQNMPMHYSTELSEKLQCYISYAWKDDTPEGQKREDIVDELCTRAQQHGNIEILRDKDVMKTGDRISRFMDQIGQGKKVFVILSDKYLKSSYCMYELFEIWRNCRQDDTEFVERVLVYKHADAVISEPIDRAKYIDYWKEKIDELEAMLKKHGNDFLGVQDYANYRNMKEYANSIGDILFTVSDTLHPKNVDELIKHGLKVDE